MRFISFKEIHLELGISPNTLEYRVDRNLFPPFQKNPNRANGRGYFENIFNFVKQIQIPKGRPRKINVG